MWTAWRRLGRRAVSLWIGFLVPGVLLAQEPSFELRLPSLELDAGEVKTAFVLGDLRERTEAFSFAFDYDPSIIEIELLSIEDTALTILNRGRGPEWFDGSPHEDLNDGKAGAFFASIFGYFSLAYLPPGENFPMLKLRIRGLQHGVARLEYSNVVSREDGFPIESVFSVEGQSRSVAAGEVVIQPGEIVVRPSPGYLRGDADGSGGVTLIDSLILLQVLFDRTRQQSHCEAALDFNQDYRVNLQDAIMSLRYQFADGPTPAPPYPNCALVKDVETFFDCTRPGPCTDSE